VTRDVAGAKDSVTGAKPSVAGAKPYVVLAKNLAPESDNKIHDDAVARQFGFTGALVPGVEVFAYATQPFVAAWGEAFLARGTISARFRSPVYDGDEVRVLPGDGDAFTLVGPDGSVRAEGTAALPDERLAVDADRFAVADLPVDPPPADASSLAVGTVLGVVREHATAEAHDAYLAGVGDSLPIYTRFVHPGALLRVVNAVLYRSVRLGPWIHTGSDCRFLAPAPAGSTLEGRGVVTDRYERKGRQWVRFDALVLADGQPVMLTDHVAIYDLGAPAA
jgi:acyl dehydratase